MLSSVFCIQSISKVSNSVLGLFESEEEREQLLSEIESIQNYLSSEPEILGFFEDKTAPKEIKKESLELLRGTVHEYLVNALCFLVDVNLISHISLFLSTLRSGVLKLLKIKQIFVYSSYEIQDFQRNKIERLWAEKYVGCTCQFTYLLDKSLRLGIKVQCGGYVEEFTIRSSLLQIELKFDNYLAH